MHPSPPEPHAAQANAPDAWAAVQRWFERTSQRPPGGMALALRESFLALFPMFMLMSATMLLQAGLVAIGLGEKHVLVQACAHLDLVMRYVWPVAFAIVFAMHLAHAKEVDSVMVVVLVLSLMLGAIVVNEAGMGSQLAGEVTSVAAVALPAAAVYLLRLLLRWLPQPSSQTLLLLSPALARSIAYAPAFVVSAGLLFVALTVLPRHLHLDLDALMMALPTWLGLALHVLLVNLMWWFGINGARSWDTVFGSEGWTMAAVGGTTPSSLSYAFVYPGGAGATLALSVCLWFYLRSPNDRRVLRWSLPLQLFNINEPLLYGLPVVGNRLLLLPMMLAPLASAELSYWVVMHEQIFTIQPMWHWMVPYFVNAPAIGGQAGKVLALQGVCFAMSVLIYAPFARRWARLQDPTALSSALGRQLAVGSRIELAAEQRFISHQQSQHALRSDVQEALALVGRGELTLWYQPKVDVVAGRVYGVEALLRLVLPDGQVLAPGRFLPPLVQAGFGAMFDLWVARRVVDDVRRWREQGYVARVGINLTADSIADDAAFSELLGVLRQAPPGRLELEVLESSFSVRTDTLHTRLDELRHRGLRVVVDDFGTGYSNLAQLHAIGVDGVKIDRSLLTTNHHGRGAVLYREVCHMLQRLGYVVTAEGVETVQDLAFVVDCGVQRVQGWYFSAAVPAEGLPERVNEIHLRLAASHTAAGAPWSVDLQPVEAQASRPGTLH